MRGSTTVIASVIAAGFSPCALFGGMTPRRALPNALVVATQVCLLLALFTPDGGRNQGLVRWH